MRSLLTAACVLLSASLASIAAYLPEQNAKAEATLAQQEEELARVGEATTGRVCNECHDLEEVTVTRRTPREWADMVNAMANRGATATSDELAIIKRYVTRYFGLVPVNTASAQVLTGVLGLSSQDAEKVVAYRKTNGRFADTAALLKVPGIDRTTIDAQPEALRFD